MSDLRAPLGPRNGTPQIPREQLAGVKCGVCDSKQFQIVKMFAFAFNKLDPNEVVMPELGDRVACVGCGAILRRKKEGRWTTAWRCVEKCPDVFPAREELQEHLEHEHVELAPDEIEKHLAKEE